MRTTDARHTWLSAPFHMVLFILFLTTASCGLPKIVVLDDPLTPEEHINLGLAYEKRGETDEAVKEYRKAATDLPAAYLYLGNIYYGKGEYSEAEKYYRTAIEKKPDLADSYNNLAWLLYVRGGDLNEARQLAERATELDPSNGNYRDTLEKLKEKTEKEETSPSGER